jgi:hypothetical protein
VLFGVTLILTLTTLEGGSWNDVEIEVKFDLQEKYMYLWREEDILHFSHCESGEQVASLGPPL